MIMVNCRYNANFDCRPYYGHLKQRRYLLLLTSFLLLTALDKSSVSYFGDSMVLLHRLIALSAASRYLGLWVDSYMGCTFLSVSNNP